MSIQLKQCYYPPRGYEGDRGSGRGCGDSHAYSRKYSHLVRLRLLGFKAPYFRNLPSQNNTQLFCSVVCQLRLALFCEHIVVNYNIVDWKQVWEANEKSRPCDLLFSYLYAVIYTNAPTIQPLNPRSLFQTNFQYPAYDMLQAPFEFRNYPQDN